MTEDAERPLRITPDMLVRRRVDFERRMRRLPPVTLALIAVLGIIMAGEASFEVTVSAESLIAVGALARAAVLAGEWWRLVSAVFLHGSVDHFFSNAIALFILGMVCEHAFGRVQFLWLFLVSGVAGSVVSMAVAPGPSVGASGAIFGLQGAAIVLFRRYRDRLLIRDRRIGAVLLVWAIYAVVEGLLSPFIDNGAHVGGFMAGMLLARRLHPIVLDPPSDDTVRRIARLRWVIAAILAYTVVGWAFR